MVLSYKPKSALLQKYIYGFNTFDNGVDLRVNYLAFPQLGSTLFFVKDADLIRGEHQISIAPSAIKGVSIEVLGKYTAPIRLSYGGFVEEISVDFTPLGINYFFSVPYASLAPNTFQELGVAHWQDFAPQLFESADMLERLERLEMFLEAQFMDPKLHTLQLAVDSLMQPDPECSVAQAAAKAGIS